MHYNSLQQTYLITYKGTDDHGKMFIVDFTIEQREDLILTKVDRYLDASAISTVVDPPEITNNSFFNVYTVTTAVPFSLTLSAENAPTNWEIVGSLPFSLTVNNLGVFAGTVTLPGTYYVNYKVTNSGGSAIYPLTIEAI